MRLRYQRHWRYLVGALKGHLGVFLSNDCSWHKHIDYIKEKAWGRINVMRKLKFFLDRKSLETIYLTFVRPVLEYADEDCDGGY